MAKTQEAPVELKPIEQLAERIQSLIEVLGTTREELKLALDENTALSAQNEELRGRLQAVEQQQESQTRELQSERDEIRDRVSRMLEQIEDLSL